MALNNVPSLGAYRSFSRQVQALVKKNLTLLVTRHWLSTLIQAAIVPILILALTLNINNFTPKNTGNGIGDPRPIRPIHDAITGNQQLVFVKPPHLGADVDRVIRTISSTLPAAQVLEFDSWKQGDTYCKTSFRGVSSCYAMVTFNDSPLSSSQNRTWNYTMRFDPARSDTGYSVFSGDTAYQRYWWPTQLAVDNAITNSTDVPDAYLYTSTTQEEIDRRNRENYGRSVVSQLCIVFFLSILPGIYHVVNVITTERESGLAQLIDAMGGSPTARVVSHMAAFSIIYFPTWLIFGVLYWYLLFHDSNAAIFIFWQIFSGLAILNASIFASAFFHRRRISSIFVVICFVCLGGGAALMISKRPDASTVIPLSLFFPQMNYIFVLSHIARFALISQPLDISLSVIGNPEAEQTYFVAVWTFWLLLIIQTPAYAILAIVAERGIHGLNFKGRTMAVSDKAEDSTVAIQTTGLNMAYPTSWHRNLLGFGKEEGFKALNGVDLIARNHQILCLLGVNGAGKSTTLDLVSGFHTQTAGDIFINADVSQLGVCPQRNVLFDKLTVLEHVKFWSRIKGGHEDLQALHELIAACDLTMKTNSQAKTLSGGQKRKLQLACMFVGGATVCLMDEVTSGLDPISRRTIWNIILAERSKRSMVFTTHFLDEGEVLADHIVILSKGQIKCQGSGTELKNQFGGGYRVYVAKEADVPGIDAPKAIHQDQLVYRTPDSKSASHIVSQLEAGGHTEVQIAGPTIEDVFLNVAQGDVSEQEATASKMAKSGSSEEGEHKSTIPALGQLSSGQPTSFAQQVRILMMKRLQVLPRYWAAAFLALVLPIACMPAINTFIAPEYIRPVCQNDPTVIANNALHDDGPYLSLSWFYVSPGTPVGPRSAVPAVRTALTDFPVGAYDELSRYNVSNFDNDWKIVDSYADFQAAVHDSQTPYLFITSGLYMGDNQSHPATVAQMADYSVVYSPMNLYTSARSKIRIAVYNEYASYIGYLGGGGSFMYILYAAFILAVYPTFFALYPAFEKVSNVRALQCSNGVRPLPLWTAYFLFDLVFVLVVSIAYTVTISQQFPFWWGPGYMFPICLLHGITSMLIAYIVSIRATSQLSSFLWTLGVSLVTYVIIALSSTLPSLTSDPLDVQRNSDILAYTLDLLFPLGNVVRGMAVGFNLYSIACRDDGSVVTPGSWWGYGFPITYLIIQVIALGALLIWLDSDLSFSLLRPSRARSDPTTPESHPLTSTLGVAKEAARVETNQTDLLRLINVTKTFSNSSTPAVDSVSLGLGEGEILALLGPNGAGKTTVVNMIRGELRPDRGSGDIILGDISVSRHPRLAQRRIGVCPQFDALDLLTTRQHLDFYARIKGIRDVDTDVNLVMSRVGLLEHANKQAAALSGGNKRKLSLAIALLGNPRVLILDEPSSGMDAAAKRRFWKILAEVAPGRSVLLTTHSMEEADALATRAAILSGRLLAIGTTRALRRMYSDLYQVQLVLRTAPHSSEEEMTAVETWVRSEFVDVLFEGASLGGLVNFLVPASAGEKTGERGNTVGHLIRRLEEHREHLGLQDYSIGAPTLEKVFLSVVMDSYKDEHEEESSRFASWGRLFRRGKTTAAV
ncbi:hypothetical protein B0T22DRAFT_177099 [Podospora appendiculata]|uniref:ABC transporter domain-containing protein n=1 Tax=Podospora appendiculata TaxID=314037 RepID=A0AAE0XC20_9PEZI|nr:hypothetical protein B0T22DRAFT_177099 [Podospora appendiculata]